MSVEATQHAQILQEQQLKALDKSTWLQHMTLQADGEADPEGIGVRSVPLQGVNYLEQGNFVGGDDLGVCEGDGLPQRHGYEEERSLRAAPYDWVPPQILEEGRLLQQHGADDRRCRAPTAAGPSY